MLKKGRQERATLTSLSYMADTETDEKSVISQASEGEEEERTHASSEPGSSQADNVDLEDNSMVNSVDEEGGAEEYERDGFVVSDHEEEPEEDEDSSDPEEQEEAHVAASELAGAQQEEPTAKRFRRLKRGDGWSAK